MSEEQLKDAPPTAEELALLEEAFSTLKKSPLEPADEQPVPTEEQWNSDTASFLRAVRTKNQAKLQVNLSQPSLV